MWITSATLRRIPAVAALVFVAGLSAEGTVPGEYPTGQNPWKRAGNEQQLKDYQDTLNQLASLPPEQVTAHPAAEDFPGAVPADAPRITRVIEIDARVPRWHSTGLYAAPGEVITVSVPDEATREKLEVRIGCHKDKLWAERIQSWKRVPDITRTFRMNTRLTKAANAFGGPIYIVVPMNCSVGEFQATIEGAVAAPMYQSGRTSLKEWRETIRQAPAPWAELAGEKLIISLPSRNIRSLEDPQAVVAFWDAVVSAQDELAAMGDRMSPERFVLDRQISAGYMHSGYPIMAHLDQGGKVADIDALRNGNWGFFHELGHNHQNRDWTFSGTGEVTCNLFSMYCFERVCELPKEGHGAMKPDKREQRLQKYFNENGTFDDWKSDPFLALLTYHQLINGFGWDAFAAVFAEYRSLAKAERPVDDDARRDQFMVRFSNQVGRDLGPFFEAWKIPTSDAARNSIADLPSWMPEDFPPGDG